MNPRGRKFAAIASLAAAIVLLVVSLTTGLQAGAITGPGALVLTPRNEVWIGVGQQLWRATVDGHVLQALPVSETDLPGPPSNLLHHPGGQIVATVRGNPGLYFLDPATARVARAVVPRWPADLKDHGNDAINVAFAPDGRFAVATGGGHAVALFDAEGRYLARTGPDTYRFTNGLWWEGDDLWTTDTNRFVLRRLDGKTLAVAQSVALSSDDVARFLGPARATSGAGDPMAALIRYRNSMIEGRVVLVRRDGGEVPLAHDGKFEPNDVEWVGQQLLASDGASFSVRRWNAQGEAQPPFGDAAFADRLRQIASDQTGLQRLHQASLWAGIAAFAVALLLALNAQRAAQPPRGLDAPLDLSHLGTPLVDNRAMGRLALRVLGPALLLAMFGLTLHIGPVREWLHALITPDARLRVAGLTVAAIAAVGIWFVRATRRKAKLPVFEPLFNAVAVFRLRAASSSLLPMAEGEHVVETFMLMRQEPKAEGSRILEVLMPARESMCWVVWTNRRVRIFKSTRTDHGLDVAFDLMQISALSTRPGSAAPIGTATRLMLGAGSGGWLEISLHGGQTILGSVTSALAVERLVRQFRSTSVDGQAMPRLDTVRGLASVAAGPTRVQAAIASAVLPGLGQWWQRRAKTALLFFVPWSVILLALTIPVAWTVVGSRADVHAWTIALAVLMQIGYPALAARDAWKTGRQAMVDA